jgi:transposase-like protein
MKGKFKHNKNGKFESRYSEEFKRKVIEESVVSGESLKVWKS